MLPIEKGFSRALAKTCSTENSKTQSKTFVSSHNADKVKLIQTKYSFLFDQLPRLSGR